MGYGLGGIIANHAAEISAALFLWELSRDAHVFIKMRPNFNSTKS